MLAPIVLPRLISADLVELPGILGAIYLLGKIIGLARKKPDNLFVPYLIDFALFRCFPFGLLLVQS